MMRILRIEGCVQCYHKRHTIGFPPRCAHPAVVELGADERPTAWRAIPYWCPLEDVAAPEAPRSALLVATKRLRDLFAGDPGGEFVVSREDGKKMWMGDQLIVGEAMAQVTAAINAADGGNEGSEE